MGSARKTDKTRPSAFIPPSQILNGKREVLNLKKGHAGVTCACTALAICNSGFRKLSPPRGAYRVSAFGTRRSSTPL
eukprot:1799136-Prymnesium_polylepis.2